MLNYSLTARYSTPGDTSSTQKYYANVQYSSKMTFDEFCQHIADHGSVYHRSDVASVLTQMVDCLRELVLEGYRVRMGDLGTYAASLKSVGEEDASDFDSSNITYVGVKWLRGDRFANMVDDATFQVVATREATAAVLAAVKAGETTADWSSTEDTTTDEDGGETD